MTLFGSPAILALPAGFHTMTTKIWSLFQYPPKPELAAAASLPLLVLTVMLLRAEHMILGRRGYSVVGGKQGDPRLVRLGAWKWVALGLAFLVLMNPVFLPYGALLNAAFSPVATQFVTLSTATLHNITFRVLRALRDQARVQEHDHPRSSVGHRGHADRARHLVSYGAQGDRRLARARVPRDRAGRDSRHRARRRACS